MSVVWLGAPAALAGVTLVLLPIAVHLLVRQHARVQVFPSLRFLRETQLAALRRRRIEDVALLACRAAIIVTAVVALAGPLLLTAARTAGYASRKSVAIIASDASGEAPATSVAEGAFRSAAFKRAVMTDAIADATRWLDGQPPSSREIVVTGALSRGTVTAGDLQAIPSDVGIRFARSPSSASTDLSVSILTRRNGALARVDRSVHLASDATRVTDGGATIVRNDLVAIAAGLSDTSVANAALLAALDAGIPWVDFERRVFVAWEGADDAAVARRASGARVIRMPKPAQASAAADAVREALIAGSRPTLVDPVAIADEQLVAWTRPAGPPAANAPLTDEGDRRWVWAIAIVLMGVEWWLRRRRSVSDKAAAGLAPEVRVA